MIDDIENTSEFLFYTGHDGSRRIEVIVDGDTVWLNQRNIAEIFNVQTNTITYHIGEIYKSGELQEDGTTRKIRVVQKERDVSREVDFYNLDTRASRLRNPRPRRKRSDESGSSTTGLCGVFKPTATSSPFRAVYGPKDSIPAGELRVAAFFK